MSCVQAYLGDLKIRKYEQVMYKSTSPLLLLILLLSGCFNNNDNNDNNDITQIDPTVFSMPHKTVGTYPIGEPSLEYFANLKKDENDIILLDAHGKKDVYTPSMIAKYVMANKRAYINNNKEEYVTNGLLHSDWLLDNLICSNEIGYWELTAPLDDLVVWESTFKSAMTNGLAIFALSQMIEFTPQKQEYLDAIECALNAFNYDVSEGGVSTITDTYTWFEEYAMESRAKVLNGGLFGLAGVWGIKEHFNSPLATELFDKMVEALVLRISEYDYDHTTLYHTNLIEGSKASFGRVVHGTYNEIHAIQLQWLYSVTGKQIFLDYTKKFYKYESYETLSIQKNNVESEKLSSIYKYHYFEEIKSNDELKIKLRKAHNLQEVHIYFYGYYTELPYIALESDSYFIDSISQSTIRYMQDGNQHTSIGIYKLPAEEVINGEFKIKFSNPTYNNANFIRQIEVITDDNDQYFLNRYNRWSTVHKWPTDYPVE